MNSLPRFTSGNLKGEDAAVNEISTPSLQPDCSNCAALCCVVFAFDKSESFAIDKRAGEVCPNLEETGRCGIFASRADLGFKGCVSYDCYGAGQLITQEVFEGRSWRDDSRLTQPMGEALSVLRRIHEQLLLLRSASRLPLTQEECSTLEKLHAELDPGKRWTQNGLQEFPIETAIGEVAVFLRSLRHHLEQMPSEHI